MKAAFMYGKRDIRIREVPVPEIQADEVLIRVKRAAICGSDVRAYLNGILAVACVMIVFGEKVICVKNIELWESIWMEALQSI